MEKPLGPQRWAGVIDSVGGTTLAAAAAQTMYRGSIASTGMHTSRTLLSRTIHRALSTLVLSAFKVLSVSAYPALYHPSSHTLLNLILLSFTPWALCLPSSSSLSFLTLPNPTHPPPQVHHIRPPRLSSAPSSRSEGVAGGGQLETTVFPFILRGVRLLGVDSTLPWRVEGYPDDEARWQEWRQVERLTPLLFYVCSS